jgi:hypothetical protein
LDNFDPETVPTPDMIAELPYGNEFAEKCIIKLRSEIHDLDKRFDNLETMLQQLWDDLDPDVINVMIERGKCAKCSSMSGS